MIEANIRIRFLAEALDEQQLVEVQEWIGQDQTSYGPACPKIQASPPVVGGIARKESQFRFGRLQLLEDLADVNARPAQLEGQAPGSLDAVRRGILRHGGGDLRRRPGAQTTLIGRPSQRDVLRVVSGSVDFDLVKVEEYWFVAGHL